MDMLDLFISAFGLATLVMFLFCLFMIFYILFFEDDEDLKKNIDFAICNSIGYFFGNYGIDSSFVLGKAQKI